MGNKRKTKLHLPEYIHYKHGAYYFVEPSKKRRWVRMDSNFAKAMSKWAELIQEPKKLITMTDVINRYMLEVAPKKAAKTYRENIRQSKKLKLVFGHMKPEEIKKTHIYSFLDLRGKKTPIAANREISLLSDIFRKAIRWGLIENNPCFGVEKHKEKIRERYITDEEFKIIKEKVPPFIAAIMDVAYLTSLRKADILNIRLADIKEDGLHITQGKTRKRQIFELTPDLKNAINRARSARKVITGFYLFCTQRGQPYTTDGFDSIWQRAIKKTGILDIHFHDIRAKAITDAKEQGIDAKLLSGHKTTAMVDRYEKSRKIDRVIPLSLKKL